MSALVVNKSEISGTIQPPSSKSHSIRALLFASLAKGTSKIENLLDSPDVVAMRKICGAIGANITETSRYCEITGVDGELDVSLNNIDVANSGQILRFMTAIFALQKKEVSLQGDDSANLRPMEPLINAVNGLGGYCYAKHNNNCAPIIVKGIVTGGEVSIVGSDSQHVSALLMSLPFAKGNSILKIHSPGEKPWVDLTISWLDRLGIRYIRNNYDRFELFGNTRIKSFDYKVPADFSSMAFPLVAALVTHSKLTIKNLDFSDRQGDKVVVDICRKMGAKIISTNDILTVLPSKLHGITIDLDQCIDAVPIMCILAVNAIGETRLGNIKIARTKECDRLSVMTKELRKMGADITEGDDHLIIRHSVLFGNTVSSHYDHRIAMALVVAGLNAATRTTVLETNCINKSYPNFIEDIQAINCQVKKYEYCVNRA